MKLFQRRNIQFGSCRLLGTDKILQCHTAKTNISNEQWLPMQTSSSFKIHTVQCAGYRPADDGLGHGGGHFIMKMWRGADISVTSRSRDQWSIGPNYRLWSVDWHRVTAGQSSSHSMWENSQHNSPSLHLPLCSFLRSQITVCGVLPSSLVLVSASPPLQ